MYDNLIIDNIGINIYMYIQTKFYFCSMFSVYLSFAFSLWRVPGTVIEDPSMYMCDTLIEGTVCEGSGLAVYVTHDNPPTRPSTFYPISHAQWTFAESSNSGYLGVSSSDYPNISGKYSCLFTAPSTGEYTFQIEIEHTINNNVCHFSQEENPGYIEADLSYSGEGEDRGLVCVTRENRNCANKYKLTEYWFCRRGYYLVAGNQYPLFAGVRYNWTVPQSDNLYLRFIYQNPSGKTLRVSSSESIVGMTGYYAYVSSSPSPSISRSPSRSPSPSPSKSPTSSPSNRYTSGVNGGSGDSSSVTADSEKVSTVVISGSCAGVVVIVAICAVALWCVVRKRGKDKNPSSSGSTGLNKDGKEPDRSDTRASGAYSSNMSSVRKERLNSDRSGRSRSGHGSRMASAYSSHMNGVHRSRSDSRRSSRSRSGHGSRMASAYSSHMNGVRRSRSDSRRSSRSRSGHGSRMASAYSSHMNGVRNRSGHVSNGPQGRVTKRP